MEIKPESRREESQNDLSPAPPTPRVTAAADSRSPVSDTQWERLIHFFSKAATTTLVADT